VAVSIKGRLLTCYPRWPGPHCYDLAEVLPGNNPVPYPNGEMNSWQEGTDVREQRVCVQAVYIEDTDTMWVADPTCPDMWKPWQLHDDRRYGL
jgi:hypothetical protein